MHAVIEEIRNERQRQIEVEGWTPEHDDLYFHGEIGLAAACYAAPEPLRKVVDFGDGIERTVSAWPWDEKWDKRTKHERRRQLVIAAALIVAEIERLDRSDDRAWGYRQPSRPPHPDHCHCDPCRAGDSL